MSDFVLPITQLMESSWNSSSSSSSDEEEIIILYTLKKIEKRKRCRIQQYVSGVVPQYSSMEFKAHFRLHKSTFDSLLGQGVTFLYCNTSSGIGKIFFQSNLETECTLQLRQKQYQHRQYIIFNNNNNVNSNLIDNAVKQSLSAYE